MHRMSSNPPLSPTRRADAERNRVKILAAGRSAFADPEAEVSMAEISRRAGVGMATLYRNFPGRRELLEALYTDEVDAVCGAAELVDGKTPGAVLMAWLQRFFAFVTTKQQVASELLAHSDRSNPIFGESRARVLAAGRPLLAAANRSQEVRDDLTLEQITDMVVAIATIRGDTRYLEPILQTALDGLSPPTGLPGHPRTTSVAHPDGRASVDQDSSSRSDGRRAGAPDPRPG
jgi:AcrR family transcriptional regulator